MEQSRGHITPGSLLWGALLCALMAAINVIMGLNVGYADGGSFVSVALAAAGWMLLSGGMKNPSPRQLNFVQIVGSSASNVSIAGFMPFVAIILASAGQWEIAAIAFAGTAGGLLFGSRTAHRLGHESKWRFTEAKAIAASIGQLSGEREKKHTLKWLFVAAGTVMILYASWQWGESSGTETAWGIPALIGIAAASLSPAIALGIIFPWQNSVKLASGAVIALGVAFVAAPHFEKPQLPIMLLFVPAGIVQFYSMFNKEYFLKSDGRNERDLLVLLPFHAVHAIVLWMAGIPWHLALLAQGLMVVTAIMAQSLLAMTNNNFSAVIARIGMLVPLLAFGAKSPEAALAALSCAAYGFGASDYAEDYVTSLGFGTKRNVLLLGKIIGAAITVGVATAIIAKLGPEIKANFNDTAAGMALPALRGIEAFTIMKDVPTVPLMTVLALGFAWEFAARKFSWIPSGAFIALGFVFSRGGGAFETIGAILAATLLTDAYQKKRQGLATDEFSKQLPLAVAIGCSLFAVAYNLMKSL